MNTSALPNRTSHEPCLGVSKDTNAGSQNRNTHRFAVQCAMEVEAAPFMAAALKTEPLPAPFRGASAKLISFPQYDLVIITSSIGLVASATSAQWAILSQGAEFIISAGTAGGIAADVEVGDVVISSSLRYGHADATDFGYQLGQVPGQPEKFVGSTVLIEVAAQLLQSPQLAQNLTQDLAKICASSAFETTLPASTTGDKPTRSPKVRIGEMLSGDTFVTAANVGQTRENFPAALATDMESAAIAQVCHAYDVNFLSVRGISDLCGPAANQDHHLSAELTSKLSASVVLRIIDTFTANP